MIIIACYLRCKITVLVYGCYWDAMMIYQFGSNHYPPEVTYEISCIPYISSFSSEWMLDVSMEIKPTNL